MQCKYWHHFHYFPLSFLIINECLKQTNKQKKRTQKKKFPLATWLISMYIYCSSGMCLAWLQLKDRKHWETASVVPSKLPWNCLFYTLLLVYSTCRKRNQELVFEGAFSDCISDHQQLGLATAYMEHQKSCLINEAATFATLDTLRFISGQRD